MAIWALALIAIGFVPLDRDFAANLVAIRSVHSGEGSTEFRADMPPADAVEPPAPVLWPTAVAESQISSPAIESDRVAEPAVTENKPPVSIAEMPREPMPLESAMRNPQAEAQPTASAPAINIPKELAGQPALPKPVTCAGDFGTALTFARNPAQAAKLAKLDKKLVFFLHVSGNFEDAGFT